MTNTTKKLIATATLSLVSLAGFAGVAGAETFGPAPQPGPGPIIAVPAPEPQPDPPAPEPELPIAQQRAPAPEAPWECAGGPEAEARRRPPGAERRPEPTM